MPAINIILDDGFSSQIAEKLAVSHLASRIVSSRLEASPKLPNCTFYWSIEKITRIISPQQPQTVISARHSIGKERETSKIQQWINLVLTSLSRKTESKFAGRKTMRRTFFVVFSVFPPVMHLVRLLLFYLFRFLVPSQGTWSS